MKLNKLENLFKRAYTTAELSPDAETKVGCVAVRPDMSIIGESYNGFIRGASDANIPNTRASGKSKFILHAEQNLITSCAKHGSALNGAIVIVTFSPCIHCARLLFQCNVTEIYFDKEYKDFKQQLNMPDLEFNLEKIGKYTKITLGVKGE